jgi:hypothetical protein
MRYGYDMELPIIEAIIEDCGKRDNLRTAYCRVSTASNICVISGLISLF